MKKRTAAMFLAFWMTLSLVGCGGGDTKEEVPEETPPPVEEVEPITESEPIPEPEPEPVDPARINPLSGEEMDGEYRDLRPVAVMFNNLKAAQPQLGVSRADIIYEIPAEGGITRMLGVFQTMDGVGNLGSIRSTRPYYLRPHWAMMHCWFMQAEVRMHTARFLPGLWIIWTVCRVAAMPGFSGVTNSAERLPVMSTAS